MQLTAKGVLVKYRNLETYKDFKKAARSVSIADDSKREFIMHLFGLQGKTCSTKYAIGLKLASKQIEDQLVKDKGKDKKKNKK